jgi:hypothetical protein
VGKPDTPCVGDTAHEQTFLADFFHINRSTICRDMTVIKKMWAVATCPTCDTVLRVDRIEDLEKRGRIRLTRRP